MSSEVQRRVSTDRMNGAFPEETDRREQGLNREAGAMGEPLSAGPTIREDVNGERKIVSAENGNAEHVENKPNIGQFTSVN